jgi:hypothetical protein
VWGSRRRGLPLFRRQVPGAVQQKGPCLQFPAGWGPTLLLHSTSICCSGRAARPSPPSPLSENSCPHVPTCRIPMTPPKTTPPPVRGHRRRQCCAGRRRRPAAGGRDAAWGLPGGDGQHRAAPGLRRGAAL